MSKHNITLFNISSWQDFKCLFGIHDYQKGVYYALGSRKDVCKNPNCWDWTATWGQQKHHRFVNDPNGSKLYEDFKLAQYEKRRVLIEKYDPKMWEPVMTIRKEELIDRHLYEDAL